MRKLIGFAFIMSMIWIIVIVWRWLEDRALRARIQSLTMNGPTPAGSNPVDGVRNSLDDELAGGKSGHVK